MFGGGGGGGGGDDGGGGGGGVGGGGSKQDKNISSRQQDAHGAPKDEWLDPGNGEEKRGRGYSRSQLCAN